MTASRKSIVLNDLITIDDENSRMTSAVLFDKLDRDGDGTISRDEFHKMYDTVKQVVAKEHAIEKATNDKLAASKRRNKLLCFVVAVAVPVIAVLLAGNAAMAFVVQQMTKEVHVSGSSLMDKNNFSVATSATSFRTDLANLFNANENTLNSIKACYINTEVATGDDSTTFIRQTINAEEIFHIKQGGADVLIVQEATRQLRLAAIPAPGLNGTIVAITDDINNRTAGGLVGPPGTPHMSLAQWMHAARAKNHNFNMRRELQVHRTSEFQVQGRELGPDKCQIAVGVGLAAGSIAAGLAVAFFCPPCVLAASIGLAFFDLAVFTFVDTSCTVDKDKARQLSAIDVSSAYAYAMEQRMSSVDSVFCVGDLHVVV